MGEYNSLDENLVLAKEAAQMLNISYPHLLRLKTKIKHKKIGRSYLFDIEDAKRYFQEKKERIQQPTGDRDGGRWIVISTPIDKSMSDRIDEYARIQSITKAEVLRLALNQLLDRRRKVSIQIPYDLIDSSILPSTTVKTKTV